MDTTVATQEREGLLVADSVVVLEGAGVPVRRALPSSVATYDLVDPFLLLDEARLRISRETANFPPHPHRGFEIVTYPIQGSMSQVQTADGKEETARVPEGGLLRITAGRGMWHGEGAGGETIQEGEELHGLQLWINLARAEKQVDPAYQVVEPEEIRVRRQGDARVRVLVGDGSPTRLRTPALYLDVALPNGGRFATSVPPEFQGFAYLLEGEGVFGANRARATAGQLVVLGPGGAFGVDDAAPGTRFIVCAGRPHRERPLWRGPYVD